EVQPANVAIVASEIFNILVMSGEDRAVALAKVKAAIANGPSADYVAHCLDGYFHLRAFDEKYATLNAPSYAAVSGQAWNELLASAQASIDAFEQAWEIDPADPFAPTQGIMSAVRTRRARPYVDLWFERAMRADPDNYDACYLRMLFSRTDWYGTYYDLDWFASVCRIKSNSRNKLALIEAEGVWFSGQHFARGPATLEPAVGYLRKDWTWRQAT